MAFTSKLRPGKRRVLPDTSETAQRHNDEAGCPLISAWQVKKVAAHFRALQQQEHVVALASHLRRPGQRRQQPDR